MFSTRNRVSLANVLLSSVVFSSNFVDFFLSNAAEVVAQFKFTVLLMPNGPQKITGLTFDPTAFQTENCITDEEIKKLITSSTRNKPNKKKKPATDGNKVGQPLI